MITDFSGNHGDGNGIMDLRRIQDLNLYRCYPGLLSTQMQYHYANPPMERERLELPMTEVVWSTARCHTIRRTLQEDPCEIRTHDVIRRSFCRRAQSTTLATDQMLPTRIELVTLGSSRQSSTTELQKQEMHEARLELASLYLMKIALLPSKLLMQCPWQDSNLRLFRSTTELQGTIRLLAYQHTWQCICLFTCMCQANRKRRESNTLQFYLRLFSGELGTIALTSNDSLHCSSLHRNLIAHAAYLGTAMMARRERRERRGDDGAMWAMWNEDGSERAMWGMKRHCNNDVTGFTNNSRIVLQSPLRCSTMLIYQESGKTKEGSHDNDGRIAYNRRCSASSQNIRIHCQTVVQTRRDKSQKDWQKLEGQTRRLARVYRPKTRRRDRKLKIKPAKCWQLFENLATASLASNLAWKLEMPSHTQRCHNVMIPYLAKKSKILCIETWACARKIRMPMRKNPQCHVCKQEYAVSIWQPDLDNETTLTFYRPGFHVRGFMAIHLGEQCKSMLENGETVTFTYKKQQFHANPHSIQHAHDEHSMIDALPSVESEDMR